jgi:SAM-dependent methyltransferase
MQNGHSDPAALLRQLRSEVRKRKLALEPSAPQDQISPPEVIPPVGSVPEVVPPVEVTQSPVAPAREKPHLKRARTELDRAAMKNESVRRWPRFLRGLRRNQGAVNQSLIRGISAVLETLEWLHRKFAALDSRVADQNNRSEEHQHHLVEFRRQLELRTRQIVEQEGRAEQQRQKLAELDQKIEGRRLEVEQQRHLEAVRQEERAEQHRQQLEAHDRRLEQQARRAMEAEQLAARQGQTLTELERSVEDRRQESIKEERRVTEQHRVLAEQQKQLLELSYKLVAYQTDTGARFERAAAQQLSDKRQLLEVESFVREQEKQTVEERRQLSELSRKLAEHQELANARWQKRAEQRQEDGRRLSDLQEFADAQHRQNTSHSRLLEEQANQLVQVREILEQSSRRLEGTGERVSQHAETLKEMQTFVSAQQKQTGEEQRQFSEVQEFVRQQQEQTAEAQRQFSDLQAFVRQQQEQTAEAQRQFSDLQAFVRQQEEQTVEAQRQFSDLQEFVRQQQKQTGEEQRQFSELQEFVRQQHDQASEKLRQVSDLQEFVRQQQEQTAEEQRQFSEQRKQLEEFSLQLVEYQNDVCARYHLTGEEIEQQKKQMANMQEFVRAQEKQTREEERQLQEQQAHLAEIRGGLEEWRSAAGPSAALLAEIGNLRDKINAVQSAFAIIQGHLAKAESPELIKTIAPTLSDELAKHEADAFYLAFENQFRGDREEIKQRLRFYLPTIEQTKAITGTALALDVGCGRGEWLELLREHGYDGVGVDLNLCMVEECRSRGLKAESVDAIAYLREQPAGSLSLVTGFHIVEHLSFTQLFELFRETLRVLRPRGCAIFETPNPECARVPAYSFYLDPTHRNPIPHELLTFAARQAGFGATRIERLQSYFEEGKLVGYLDYAGVFTK